MLASLPPAPKRTIELLDGRIVCLLFDKATLDEEDILGASVIVFGKSPVALVRRVGTRVFVAPGRIQKAGGGVVVLDDSEGGISITVGDATGVVTMTDRVEAVTRVKVQGDA